MTNSEQEATDGEMWVPRRRVIYKAGRDAGAGRAKAAFVALVTPPLVWAVEKRLIPEPCECWGEGT